MRQYSLIALVGMLALLVVSCGGGDESAQQSPTPSSPAAPSPSASASPQTSAGQPFSSPPVVAQVPENAPSVPGLVQSTNPDSRVEQVQKGRKDPFAIIPVQPVVKVSPTAGEQGAGSGITTGEVPKPVPSIPIIPVIPPLNFGVPSPSRPRQTSIIARLPSRPRVTPSPRVISNPRIIPNPQPTKIATPPVLPGPLPSFKPELPRLPEPTLAQNVEVTGVIQVDGQPEAIVKAPNEPSSRYVMVGQRLANGQVLVKRIEMNEGSTPIVILEQYGIEVARAVGEKSGPSNQQPGRPTAAIPLDMQHRKNLSSSVA